MSVVHSTGVTASTPKRAIIPPGTDIVVLGLLLAGFALLYLPAYADLSTTVWATDEQGHGPIILAVSAWLLYSKRHELAEAPFQPVPWLGWPLLVFALAAVCVRPIAADHHVRDRFADRPAGGAAAVVQGRRARLRLVWFPLFFLVVHGAAARSAGGGSHRPAEVRGICGGDQPAVRTWATRWHAPGSSMSVGPYQLLVADACAGLNSMFTLEALGHAVHEPDELHQRAAQRGAWRCCWFRSHLSPTSCA